MKNGLKTLSVLLISFSIIGCASDIQKAQTLFKDAQYEEAHVYLKPLANSGDPIAQYYLGQFSMFGLADVAQDTNQAVNWYTLSAEREIPAAMYQLASISYSSGNVDTSLDWLNLSARWGFTPAITALTSLSKDVPSPDLLLKKTGRPESFFDPTSPANVAASKTVNYVHGTGDGPIPLPNNVYALSLP